MRERLRIAPGDKLRYIIDESGMRMDKSSPRDNDDPLVAFTEWASAEDDEDFADL